MQSIRSTIASTITATIASSGAPTTASTIRLPDGRTLSYRAYGPADGAPVLFFHGAPASHPNFRFFARNSVLHQIGIRVLAVDRPGMGESTFQPGRDITDWPADVAALLDALVIPRAGVLAHSCGSSYALACAVAMPDRIHAVSLVGAAPPHYDSPFREQMLGSAFGFLQLAAKRPEAARLALRAMSAVTSVAPGLFVRQAASSLPAADKCVLDSAENRDAFVAMMRATLRNGPRGAQHDAALVFGPWELPLESITMPVDLWHGEQDLNVPMDVARFYRDAIPTAELTTYPSDGHLSIMTKRGRQILERLRERLEVPSAPAPRPQVPRDLSRDAAREAA